MCRTGNLKLTIVVLCPIIITVLIIFSLIKKLEKNYNDSRKSYTTLSEFVQESTNSRW